MAVPTVPFGRVRPFQARIDPPIAGESLLGFVTRALSVTPVKQLMQGLALGGVATGAPMAIATTLTGKREIAGVAKLLQTTPEEIRRRIYADSPIDHNRRETIDFFDVTIRAHYREGKIRRVSPRALKNAPYHRAVWELRPFSFDPQTREMLIDTCPVCKQKLGWSRAQGPAMCDRCVDKDGFPKVDLREFPQPVFEVEDEEALDFVTNLVDPDPKRKAAARRALPARWLGFSNGDLFETVMALASGLTMDPSSSKHAQGRVKKPEHFARITPDMLALAGGAIIGGDAGFSALAERYRLDVERRPSFYGRRKELGPLAYVPYDKHIEPKIRKLVDELVDADMARSVQDGIGKVRRIERKAHRLATVPDDGFLNIMEFSRQFHLPRVRLQRLADCGLVRVVRASKADRSPVRMAVADVLPLIKLLPDVIGPDAAAGLLGLPGYALPALARRNLIEKLDGPILGFMPRKEGYRRSSIEDLARRIRKRAATPVRASATRMSRAVRSLDLPVAPWDAIISAIVDGDIEVYAYPAKRLNVRNGFAVADVPAFVRAVTKRMPKKNNDGVEWVGANTVSEILKVTEIFVYRLVERRPDLLKRKRKGYSPFLLADVRKIANKYIFVPEICERGGGHGRRMCRWLRDRGVEPVISLQENRDFGFRRQKVERHLAEQAAVHVRRIAELAKAPDNERTRLIRAVEAGTPTHVAAKSVGMPYKRALICIDRWRDTGDWALGKGGIQSPLDQHVEWLRALMEKNPRLSLSGIRVALKTKHKVSTDDGTLLRWLDRNGIALARRRRPQLRKASSHWAEAAE